MAKLILSGLSQGALVLFVIAILIFALLAAAGATLLQRCAMIHEFRKRRLQDGGGYMGWIGCLFC